MSRVCGQDLIPVTSQRGGHHCHTADDASIRPSPVGQYSALPVTSGSTELTTDLMAHTEGFLCICWTSGGVGGVIVGFHVVYY